MCPRRFVMQDTKHVMAVVAFVLAVVFAVIAALGDIEPDTNWLAWSIVAGWAGLLIDHLD